MLPVLGITACAHQPFLARLTDNRRLTAPSHFQDVRHLAFDLAGSALQYEPGDALAIVPQQPDSAVAAFLERLGLRPSQQVQVQLAEPPPDGAESPSFQVRVACG